MRLARFIEREAATIAAGPAAAGGLAAQLLPALVAALDAAPAAAGAGEPLPAPLAAAAQAQAVLRAPAGAGLGPLVAEFAALRAEVLRRWIGACRPAPPPLDDLARFDALLDQALAAAVAGFDGAADRARRQRLGALGHELRTPLQTVQLTALALAELDAGAPVAAAAGRLARAGARIQALLDELLDLSRLPPT